MADLSKLALDLALVESGVWVRYPGKDIDMEFRIRRTGSADYQSALIRTVRARRRELRFSDGLIDQPKEVQAPLLAKYILVDWKNLAERNGDGKLVPILYSEKRAYEILIDERFDELYQFVVEVAADNQLFIDNSTATDSGNSPDSFVGKGETT